jgi:hypothetical protein
MSDDKARAGDPDRSRINVSEPDDVREWSRKFRVSEEELKVAVKRVGDQAAAVEKYLKGKS